MSEARQNTAGKESVKLDDVILYLLTKKARNEGYKIPISDVHTAMEAVEEGLKGDLRIPLKFHKSGEHVHSRQIESALSDIIPYKIPVRNPSFSLEITEDIGDLVFERTSEGLPSEQKAVLDRLYESPEFQSVLESTSNPLHGE